MICRARPKGKPTCLLVSMMPCAIKPHRPTHLHSPWRRIACPRWPTNVSLQELLPQTQWVGAQKQNKTSGFGQSTCNSEGTGSPKHPKGSRRCFPNGVFQIPHLGLRQRKPPSERQRMPENTSVLKHLVPSALGDPDPL